MKLLVLTLLVASCFTFKFEGITRST